MQNRQQLISAINEGLEPKYLYFWGHTPSPTGEITKSCLSQWYEASFEIEGKIISKHSTHKHGMTKTC